MFGDISKTSHLLILRAQRKEGVENDVDELKLSIDSDVSETAFVYLNVFATFLSFETIDHRFSGIYSGDIHVPRGEWQCNAASSDTQFQRTTIG